MFVKRCQMCQGGIRTGDTSKSRAHDNGRIAVDLHRKFALQKGRREGSVMSVKIGFLAFRTTNLALSRGFSCYDLLPISRQIQDQRTESFDVRQLY